MTIDEIKIILRVNGATTYNHTINEVTNVTNNYSKSVGNLISTLAKLVSGAAMIKFGKQCIEAASSLQEVQNVVDVTFGSMSKEIDEWAKNSAASFGLSEKAAKEYSSRYGTMAKQFGMSTKQAAAMGKELTQLTGDVASFYNISDSAAATKLKSIFTGETESLKELGVIMTQNQLDAYAMQKGWGKTTDKMTEQEKVVLRYQFAMEKLAHAQGDFARTSDSYANSLRTFKLDIENFMVEVGKQLLPVAAQGLQAVGSIVKAVAPTIITIAETIRLYAEAWKNASAKTKAFAKVALIAVGIMIMIPKVIAIVSKAIEILTVKSLTLTTALQAMAGIIGIIFALAAFKDLSEQVEQLRQDEANLGDSAEISANSIDDLSESLDNLGESSKGLETFLASFDEVNKVGGNTSLMSSIVTTQDLDNILGAASGIDDLQTSLDSLNVPDYTTNTIFDPEWWKGLGESVMGFIDTFFVPEEFWENWKIGAQAIADACYEYDEWLKKTAPKTQKALQDTGSNYWSFSHNSEGKATTAGAWLMDKIFGLDKYAAGGFPNKGSLFLAGESGAELVGNFGGSQTRVVNQSQMGGLGASTPIIFTPTITIDGRKITSVVLDDINSMTRSSGGSPLIELGG